MRATVESNASIMNFHAPVDPEHIKIERRKAQELRKSSWWKQQVGKGMCYYCEKRFAMEQLTMDHVVPLARGGKSTKNNCVVACKDCNTEKGNKLSVEKTIEEMQQSGALPDDSDNE